MKKVIKRIWNVLQVVILIYVILMTILFLEKNKFGYTEVLGCVLVNVDKDVSSVINTTNNSDLLIIKKAKEIEDNKSAYYYSIYEDKYIVRKENIKVRDDSYTIGNGILIGRSRIIGYGALSIPLLGGFLRIVESKIGFLLLVFLPIFLVFIFQVREFILYSKNEQSKLLKKVKIDDEII